MGEDVPLIRQASSSLSYISSRSRTMLNPRMLTSKLFVGICLVLFTMPILFWHRDTIKELSVPYARPIIQSIPQFIASGTSQCLPPTTAEMFEQAVRKRATCRTYSPFTTDRARIATVTAHFGGLDEHYQRAFESHLLHSLIHGTEVRVICDPIVDDLWNKPAFILKLLMREMLKPERERLEWIMWVDRDTIILDQCRPISSFLPPTKSRVGSWWRRSDNQEKNVTDVNLLLTNDFNGLNNGIFLLRVNEWAIRLFTAILAFRHYNPDIVLPYTEQTAMEYVIETKEFKDQTRLVPQHWFNAYTHDAAQTFAERDDSTELDEVWVRRGDLLVHFPGHPDKGTVIDEWVQMLSGLPDVWEAGTVQRDVSEEVDAFWKEVGYGGRR